MTDHPDYIQVMLAAVEVRERAQAFEWPREILNEVPEGSARRERMRILVDTTRRVIDQDYALAEDAAARHNAREAAVYVERMRETWDEFADFVEDFGVMVQEDWSESLARGVRETADDLRNAASSASQTTIAIAVAVVVAAFVIMRK